MLHRVGPQLHRSNTKDLSVKVGRKMARAVREQLAVFSVKQQRFLSSEATLIVRFADIPGPVEERIEDTGGSEVKADASNTVGGTAETAEDHCAER